MQNAIALIQEWYAAQCNGDWEHSYGVKIDTLDNPGWILKIDLRETRWEGMSVPMVRTFVTDEDWMQFEIADSCYAACGDTGKLIPMIEQFIHMVWPDRLSPRTGSDSEVFPRTSSSDQRFGTDLTGK